MSGRIRHLHSRELSDVNELETRMLALEAHATEMEGWTDRLQARVVQLWHVGIAAFLMAVVAVAIAVLTGPKAHAENEYGCGPNGYYDWSSYSCTSG
jgi:hypothetical protein